MEREKLRPLYSELKRHLAQAPTGQTASEGFSDKSVWMQYNEAVNSVNEILGKDYSRFLVTPENVINGIKGRKLVRITTYRQKLGGIISSLHGQYFADEPNPCEVTPSTIINQNQQVNQSVHIQMLLELQSKIDEKVPHLPEGSKERNFLQKFKSSLSSISNITQLLGQVPFLVGRCKRRQNILKQPSFRIPVHSPYASSSSWFSQA